MRLGTKVKLFRSWTVDDRVARKLEGTCFHRFIGFSLCRFMFLEEMARSYSQKENTFVVGNTHLYLGLEDVYYLSGLPVDGRPIIVGDHLEDRTSLYRRLLDGKYDEGRGNLLRCKWLKETFESVPKDLEIEQLDPYVRAYILFIIGTLLLCDSDYDDTVLTYYLIFIENLHPNSLNSYAWGAAVLARLHQSLQKKNKTVRGAIWILELFLLERVPHVALAYLKEQPELTKKFPAFVEWGDLLCKLSKDHQMTDGWRHIFYKIQAEEIKWTPYERFSGIDRQRIFYSRTVLFDDNRIAYHVPEKAPLQLSIISMQEPSHPMINLEELLYTLHINKNLKLIQEWCEHRYKAETCIIDTNEGFVLPNPPSEASSAFDDSERRATSPPLETNADIPAAEKKKAEWSGETNGVERPKKKKRKEDFPDEVKLVSDSNYILLITPLNQAHPTEESSEQLNALEEDFSDEVELVSDSNNILSVTPLNQTHTTEESSKQLNALEKDSPDKVELVSDSISILSTTPLNQAHAMEESSEQLNASEKGGSNHSNGAGNTECTGHDGGDGHDHATNMDQPHTEDATPHAVTTNVAAPLAHTITEQTGRSAFFHSDAHSSHSSSGFIAEENSPGGAGNLSGGEDIRSTYFAPNWSLRDGDRLNTMQSCREMLSHLATPAERAFEDELTDRQALQRAWQSLGESTLAQADLLRRFERLSSDHTKLYERLSQKYRLLERDHASCADREAGLSERVKDLEKEKETLQSAFNQQAEKIRKLKEELAQITTLLNES